MKRKPKLIAKTPWLKRERKAIFAYWVVADGPSWTWFCAEDFGSLFPVSRRAARMRASLYDKKPRSGPAFKMHFRYHGAYQFRKGFWGQWGCMMPEAGNLVRQRLFNGCARFNAKKTAWLKLELED